jgi:signal transduction histidine kinase
LLKTHSIAVNLALNELDSCKLPSAAQIALYRIIQEALTNVARHSGAKAVSIRFARLATALDVTVIDDGCGFDAKAVAVTSHRLGIQSMRERAAMLGGAVSFAPRRKGTKIVVEVPLANHDSQPVTGPRNA